MSKMYKTENVLSISLLILSNVLVSFSAKYECSIWHDGTSCKIYGLELTRDNYHIEPVPAKPNAVTLIGLHGIVPILSSGICKTLPHLEKFEARDVSMEEFEENALQECKFLRSIDFVNNKFKKLGRNTFKGLPHLETIWLKGGNIPIINLDLRDSPALTSLALTNLKITEFSADNLREQINLEYLQLQSNNLFDLDVERVLKYAPNLENIWIAHNNFTCSRLKEILSVLKKKKVGVDTTYKRLKQRFYTSEKIENHCRTDEQWESQVINKEFDENLNANTTEIDEQQSATLPKNQDEPIIILENKLVHEDNKDLPKSQDGRTSNLQENFLKTLVETFENIDTLNNGFETLGKKITAQNEQILNLKEYLNKRLEEQDKKLVALQEDLLKFQNETKIALRSLFSGFAE